MLISIGFNGFAQKEACHYSLSGSVIDEHDQSNLAYATVYVQELNRGVVADSTGYYSLDGLCQETYTITVSHVSCEPVTLRLEIKGNTEKTLLLEHHIEALKALTIVGLELSEPSAIQEHMGLNTLERYGSASLGDALKEITGLSSLNTGKTLVKPMVQGLYGSRIVIVNQGVRLQDMEWGEEHAPNVDINSAGGVQLVKGAEALQYGGDAIGGTIVINATPFVPDTLYGKAALQASSNGRGGLVNADVFKSSASGWFTKIQGSLKRFGDFKAPDYYLSNSGIFEKGISLHTGRNQSNRGFDLYYSLYDAEIAILRASHIGNIDDLVTAINSQQPQIMSDFDYEIGLPKQEVTHHLARLNYFRSYESGNRWQVQYDFQFNRRLEFDVRVGDDRDKPVIDLELTTHTLSGDLDLNQKGQFPSKVGLLYRIQENFADPDTGIKRLVPNYIRYELGGFITTRHQLSPFWLLDAGIRYDFNRIEAKKWYETSRWIERGYDTDFGDFVSEVLENQILVNPQFDFHNVSVSVGGVHHWGDKGKIRFNYTLAQRAPNPSELFSDGLHQSASRIELGDLRIEQETSHKIGASIASGTNRWSWEIAPYLNHINGFILLEPEGVEQTIRGAFPVWEYQQTDARIWGVDVRAVVSWHDNWGSDHSYSYIHGQDIMGDRPLINMVPPKFRNRLTFTLPQWHQLQIRLESIYNFEQNRYPNNDFEVFLPITGELQEVDISTPPPGYHLLNLWVNTTFNFKRQNEMQVGLAIENLLNTSYRDYLNRQRFFTDEPGVNFQLSLKYSF
ncbi:MAG: TonB-dependent receptor [Cyclobacteriaceae bacterium]|nr:TonB-dependent receptor [Cyclobacteriaceae bacterium]